MSECRNRGLGLEVDDGATKREKERRESDEL